MNRIISFKNSDKPTQFRIFGFLIEELIEIKILIQKWLKKGWDKK